MDMAQGLPGPLLSGQPKVVVTDSTATISWSTDEASNSLVSFADTKSYGSGSYAMTSGDPQGQTTAHAVTLVGLQPGTLYHFRVKSATPLGTESASQDFTFQTSATHASVENYSAKVVSPTSAVFSWQTNVETASSVQAIPERQGAPQPADAETVTDAALTTLHSLTLSTLEPGTTYSVDLGGATIDGKDVSLTIPSFSTSTQNVGPLIANVKTDVAISPGEQSTIQMIVTWDTDKSSTSRVRYQEGVATDPTQPLSQTTELETNVDRKHTVVLVNLHPGSVYSFQVESTDFDGHTSLSRIFTILTPTQQAGVFQVIMNEFQNAFGWMNFGGH